jgi:hypothetical protein
MSIQSSVDANVLTRFLCRAVIAAFAESVATDSNLKKSNDGLQNQHMSATILPPALSID